MSVIILLAGAVICAVTAVAYPPMWGLSAVLTGAAAWAVLGWVRRPPCRPRPPEPRQRP